MFDVLKFSETWFSMEEKRPIAIAKVEVIEAADLKPADLNGWLLNNSFSQLIFCSGAIVAC